MLKYIKTIIIFYLYIIIIFHNIIVFILFFIKLMQLLLKITTQIPKKTLNCFGCVRACVRVLCVCACA